jgi:phage-related protein
MVPNENKPKEIEFIGSSLDDLRDFPDGARRDAGFQLDRVQHGEEPDDWKPFAQIGPGTREIKIAEDGDAFRVIYVVKFADRSRPSLF